MRSSVVADAIVASPKGELHKAAADQLKLKGVSNVIIAATDEEAIDSVDRFPKAMLILDWALGAEQCVRILGHNRRKYPGLLRPILLVAGQVSEQIIATAAEYSVTQIFTEQPSSKNLGGRLGSMMIAETLPNEIKKVLAEAAERRHAADHKGSLALLQKLLQKNPSNLRVKCEVAETLMLMDQWDAAYKILEGIDKAKPPYLRGIHLLGRCLLKLGKLEEALKILEQASLFNPHDAERLVDIGNAFLQMDRLKEAAASFDKAHAVDPTFRPAKIGQGTVKLMDGQVNDALAILREVSGDLELASLFNTSAVLNMRRGRHEAGMQLYQSAIKALGKDDKLQARLYFNMGIGYRRCKKPEKALTCFETAIKLDPSYNKAKEQAMMVVGATDPKPEPKAEAVPLPKASGDTIGLVDFDAGFDDDLDEDSLEESLFD